MVWGNLATGYWLGVAAAASLSTASSDGFITGGSTTGTMAPSAHSQSFNGTAWSDMTNLPASRTMGGGGGNSSDGIQFGGDTNSGGNWGTSPQTTTYEWNGSSWSSGGSMGTSRNMMACLGGNSTDAFAGGGTYSALNSTEVYNGSSWSSSTNLPAGLRGGAGDGKSSDAITCGGYDSSYDYNIYTFNGSSWSDSGVDIGSGRQSYNASGGSSTNFISHTTSNTAGSMDIFNGSAVTTTASTNSNRRSTMGGDGSSAFKAGDDDLGTHSETYDSSSDTWTSRGSMETSVRAAGGAGANEV